MKIKMFYQSLISDWNHSTAHFLRGVARELQKLGHNVAVFEPNGNWCLTQLIKSNHEAAIVHFHDYYPELVTHFYSLDNFDPHEFLFDADLVIVHDFNDPDIVSKIGDYRVTHNHFRLFFHDTHHRSVSRPQEIAAYQLDTYDGVLTSGQSMRSVYLQKTWTNSAWVWHEAADTTLFRPMEAVKTGDLVWIGNWGEDERSEEIMEYLLEPACELKLRTMVYGVDFPPEAKKYFSKAGVSFGGYLPNFKVPEVLSQYKVTVHIPRRYYSQSLHGIPTTRPFEAMACGIPLISAPWKDTEHLFTVELDFIMVHSKQEMKEQLLRVIEDPNLAERMKRHAMETINSRHTCHHRALELIQFYHATEEQCESGMTRHVA